MTILSELRSQISECLQIGASKVVTLQDFALSDIADGRNVKYMGRGGLVYKETKSHVTYFDNYIPNCVFFRHAPRHNRTLLFIDTCRASEFLCHGEHQFLLYS